MRGRYVLHATAKQSIPTSLRVEMRQIMKAGVDRVYTFLVVKERDPKAYEVLLTLGERYTAAWDEPVLTKNLC